MKCYRRDLFRYKIVIGDSLRKLIFFHIVRRHCDAARCTASERREEDTVPASHRGRMHTHRADDGRICLTALPPFPLHLFAHRNRSDLQGPAGGTRKILGCSADRIDSRNDSPRVVGESGQDKKCPRVLIRGCRRVTFVALDAGPGAGWRETRALQVRTGGLVVSNRLPIHPGLP